jgi:DNA-binding CsgD family transcriptional regulator
MKPESIAIHFADALCRERSLTQQESDMLVQVVMAERRERSPGKIFWTAKDDRTLQRLRRTHRAAEIAAKMGRTTRAVETRLLRLKRKERVRVRAV